MYSHTKSLRSQPGPHGPWGTGRCWRRSRLNHSIGFLDPPPLPYRIGGRALRLEKARVPSAAAREGARGTKMKGGGGARNSILGKSQDPAPGGQDGLRPPRIYVISKLPQNSSLFIAFIISFHPPPPLPGEININLPCLAS